jgi:hypothetical protein
MNTNYIDYHIKSSEARDIDPSNDCLRYISDRYELNIEQRYWLAFLYGTCYSATTVFYMYNEFPDYENVNVNRLQRWWDKNKDKTIFQTDRLRIKTSNKFVETYVSYKNMLGDMSQRDYFSSLKQPTSQMTHDNCFYELGKIKNFGRFSLFIYLEMINVLTSYDLMPTNLDLKQAESCRNGLAYYLDRRELITRRNDKKLSKNQINYLQYEFRSLMDKVFDMNIEHKNIWNVETTLCAYKKYRLGKRYIGYYIERQKKEIIKMQNLVTNGVDWDVLWEFRNENYNKKWLTEY